MPIYEFSCSKCKKDFELLVRSTDTKDVECPQCGSKKVSKKFSVFASSGSSSSEAPACTSNPRSCGRCGTGVPHSH